MRSTLIAIRFHAALDSSSIRARSTVVRAPLGRGDLSDGQTTGERSRTRKKARKKENRQKKRTVAICYLPFRTFGSNYSAAMRLDSTRSGALSFGAAARSFTARRIARPFVAAEIIYLHISSACEIRLIPRTIVRIIYPPASEKNRMCTLPPIDRSIDRSRDRPLCFSNSLLRSTAAS